MLNALRLLPFLAATTLAAQQPSRLTAQVLAAPHRAVRLFLEVGALEDHATLGGSGPVFRDAHRRLVAAPRP